MYPWDASRAAWAEHVTSSRYEHPPPLSLRAVVLQAVGQWTTVCRYEVPEELLVRPMEMPDLSSRSLRFTHWARELPAGRGRGKKPDKHKHRKNTIKTENPAPSPP